MEQSDFDHFRCTWCDRHLAACEEPVWDEKNAFAWCSEHCRRLDLVDSAVNRHPGEFGLKAFPGEQFRVSRSASFWSELDGGGPCLCTQRLCSTDTLGNTFPEGPKWLDFCEGTEEELVTNKCSLPGEKVVPDPPPFQETHLFEQLNEYGVEPICAKGRVQYLQHHEDGEFARLPFPWEGWVELLPRSNDVWVVTLVRTSVSYPGVECEQAYWDVVSFRWVLSPDDLSWGS